MELNAIDDGSGTVTSFNLVLSDSTLGRSYFYIIGLTDMYLLVYKLNMSFFINVFI